MNTIQEVWRRKTSVLLFVLMGVAACATEKFTGNTETVAAKGPLLAVTMSNKNVCSEGTPFRDANGNLQRWDRVRRTVKPPTTPRDSGIGEYRAMTLDASGNQSADVQCILANGDSARAFAISYFKRGVTSTEGGTVAGYRMDPPGASCGKLSWQEGSYLVWVSSCVDNWGNAIICSGSAPWTAMMSRTPVAAPRLDRLSSTSGASLTKMRDENCVNYGGGWADAPPTQSSTSHALPSEPREGGTMVYIPPYDGEDGTLSGTFQYSPSGTYNPISCHFMGDCTPCYATLRVPTGARLSLSRAQDCVAPPADWSPPTANDVVQQDTIRCDGTLDEYGLAWCGSRGPSPSETAQIESVIQQLRTLGPSICSDLAELLTKLRDRGRLRVYSDDSKQNTFGAFTFGSRFFGLLPGREKSYITLASYWFSTFPDAAHRSVDGQYLFHTFVHELDHAYTGYTHPDGVDGKPIKEVDTPLNLVCRPSP